MTDLFVELLEGKGRATVLKYFLDGNDYCTQKEIADDTGLSRKTVKNIMETFLS